MHFTNVDGYITIINIVNTEIEVTKGKKNHEAEAKVKAKTVPIVVLLLIDCLVWHSVSIISYLFSH